MKGKRKKGKKEISYRQNPTILTNDPSMTAWGWAVVSPKGKVYATGVIKTEPSSKKLNIRKGDDRARRITEINSILLDLIAKYDIDFIVSEVSHGSQSATAAVALGVTTAVLQTLSDCLIIGLEWFSEGDCKKAISGKRSLTKGEMIELIKDIYDVEWTGFKWRDEAVADAMAVFHLASQQSSTLKMLR